MGYRHRPCERRCLLGGWFSNAVSRFRLLTVECSPTPAAGCRTPIATTGSKLIVKHGNSEGKDRVTLKWGRGEATDVADFGDPLTNTDDYAVCLYDGSPGTPLVMAGVVRAASGCPDKPCWHTTSIGPKFHDSHGIPDGIISLKLKAGADGVAAVSVKAKGGRLNAPAPPMTVPVIAQVQAATGECWEAVFTTATFNSPDVFKSKLTTGP